MQIIQGVSLLGLDVHADSRGALAVLEEKTLPFAPKRIFFISVSDLHSTRAEHAGTSEELIVAVSGAATVDVDNGKEQASLRLAGGSQALWIRPGVWLRLKEFEPATILLVAASQPYSETRHFSQPQPLSDEPAET